MNYCHVSRQIADHAQQMGGEQDHDDLIDRMRLKIIADDEAMAEIAQAVQEQLPEETENLLIALVREQDASKTDIAALQTVMQERIDAMASEWAEKEIALLHEARALARAGL